MSKMQWFRLYSRIIDDEKLRLLAFEDRWHFVALCCLKSDGLLDEPDTDLRTRRIAVKLGVQVRELDEIGRRLREVELVDEALNPLAWDELQYKSDKSTDRVKAYRERQKKQQGNGVKRPCNVSETAQETEQNRTEQNKPRKRGVSQPDDVSDDVWADFTAHRKRKKADVTATALTRIANEAKSVGWTLNDALAEIVARGWTGFKSDWVEKRTGPSPAARQANPELKTLHAKWQAGEITAAEFDRQRNALVRRAA